MFVFRLFQEYSKRLKTPPTPPDDTWELVEQPEDKSACACNKKVKKIKEQKKDEL